jgi:ADP-dependent NAD(P)H-hydrate dehydratase
MSSELHITREIPSLPERKIDAHKGDAGRIVIIGGCCGEVMMVGAPAMAASAAFRTGSGLVQMFVPEPLRVSAAILSPFSTVRTLPVDAERLLEAIHAFRADAVVIGPGLGESLEPTVLVELLSKYTGQVVVDADGLNLLAKTPPFEVPLPHRIVITPHVGELQRLLEARGVARERPRDATSRRAAAFALVETFGFTVVLKGHGSVVTNGDRMYINETGNVGLATGGTGDVLTGVIASFLGDGMSPLEASILGVYLHGLAGDFAAEELGKRSMTAMDLIDYLPEAISDYTITNTEEPLP